MLIDIKMKKIGNRIGSQWPFENLRHRSKIYARESNMAAVAKNN